MLKKEKVINLLKNKGHLRVNGNIINFTTDTNNIYTEKNIVFDIFLEGKIEFTIPLYIYIVFDEKDIKWFEKYNITGWRILGNCLYFEANITTEDDLKKIIKGTLERYRG